MTYQALRITRILTESKFSRVLLAPVMSRAYHISHKARVEIRSSGSLTYLIDIAWMLTRQPCPRLLAPQIVASYPHRVEGTWRGQLVCRGCHLSRAIVVCRGILSNATLQSWLSSEKLESSFGNNCSWLSTYCSAVVTLH